MTAPATKRRSDLDEHAKAEADRAIAALWADYKATGVHAARDRLILHYSPLVSTSPAGSAGLPQRSNRPIGLYGIFGRSTPSRSSTPSGSSSSRPMPSHGSSAIIDELRSSTGCRARPGSKLVPSSGLAPPSRTQLGRTPTDAGDRPGTRDQRNELQHVPDQFRSSPWRPRRYVPRAAVDAASLDRYSATRSRTRRRSLACCSKGTETKGCWPPPSPGCGWTRSSSTLYYYEGSPCRDRPGSRCHRDRASARSTPRRCCCCGVGSAFRIESAQHVIKM